MTSYTKEYADNSHIWMTPAKEYAEQLHRLGFTFEDFAKEHPRLAVSEYGEDLKAELQLLQDADNQAMIDDLSFSIATDEGNYEVLKNGEEVAVFPTHEEAVEYVKEQTAMNNELLANDEVMNSYKLDLLAEAYAQDAFKEAEEYQTCADDLLWEMIDGSEWVIYYHKAHMICQNCDTNLGEAFVEDCDIKPESYNDYAVKIAFGELYARASAHLYHLTEEAAA